MSELLNLLDAVLGLQGRAQHFTASTPLLGAIPELDSMGVMDLLAALEQQFQIALADDDIDSRAFATVGSLWAYVNERRSTVSP